MICGSERMKKSIRKFVFIGLVLIFLVSLGTLLKLTVADPYFNRESNEKVQTSYHKNTDITLKKKFEELAVINSDIKGWIKIDHTVIDYPVLQSEEPTFYLDHDYEKNRSRYGSIFIDSNCKDGAKSKNILLHGHHMKDGQMFAAILKFSDAEFCKICPTITFEAPDCDENKWKIFSIFKTNTRPEQGKIFNYLVFSFGDDKSFLNYIYQLKIRSLVDTGVDISPNDQIITLSTCSYEFDDFRTVLAARKIRPDEDRSLDVDKIKANENPLMPECWYKKHGGKMPQYDDFELAYKSGKLDWVKDFEVY